MNKNGFVMIDCVLSVFIITTTILPILHYITIYTNNSITSFNYYQASILAENELETLKGKIKFGSSNGVIEKKSLNNYHFTKNIKKQNYEVYTDFSQPEDNLVKVSVKVQWQEDNKYKEFELESLL